MTTKTRREFTNEFKREAVSLLASSGRPLTQVATELGIQPSMLRAWRGRPIAATGPAATTRGGADPRAPAPGPIEAWSRTSAVFMSPAGAAPAARGSMPPCRPRVSAWAGTGWHA